MKLRNNQKAIKRPVLNGLFWRTSIESEVPPVFMSGWERAGVFNSRIRKTGATTFESEDTYQVNRKTFIAFIREINLLAETAEANAKNFISDMQRPGVVEKKEKTWANKYQELFRRYAEAFEAMTVYANDRHWFNLELVPRSPNADLFPKFVNAFLRLQSINRINIRLSKDREATAGLNAGYRELLPRLTDLVSEYKALRREKPALSAAINALKKRHHGLPRGSWKVIEPYLKGERRPSGRILAFRILGYMHRMEYRSVERHIYQS